MYINSGFYICWRSPIGRGSGLKIRPVWVRTPSPVPNKTNPTRSGTIMKKQEYGGMIMLTELFQEKFKSTKDAIPAVLDMAYGDESIGYIVLD
jgi:hypothetical protein